MPELFGIDCPKCGESTTTMVVVGRARQGQIWKCTACRGMWFDQTTCEMVLDEDLADDVREFIRGTGAGKTLPLRPPQAGYRVSARRSGDGGIRCAECGHEPVAYTTSAARHGVQLRLDVCRGHGTWFDRGEAAQFMMAVELRRYGSHGRVPEDQVKLWPDDRPEPEAPLRDYQPWIPPKQPPLASPKFYQELVRDEPPPLPRPRTPVKPAVRDPETAWADMMSELSRLAKDQ